MHDGYTWCVVDTWIVLLVMAAGHHIFALWFFFLSSIFFFPRLISTVELDVYHTSTHGVALVRI